MKPVDYVALKEALLRDEEADFRFRERRHQEWTDNSLLYRNRVITNRLTQRQTVNMPLMKGTIGTIRANTDEFPSIEYDELGNDKEAQIILNAYWEKQVERDRLILKDAVDKKQEYLYGRTFRKLNLVNGFIVTEVKEAFDMLIDRYADPSDLDETADHFEETGIYRTIGQLEDNANFDREAVARIKKFYGTKSGLVKAEETSLIAEAKNQRLENMGVPDMSQPLLGYLLVELKAFFKKVWDSEDKEFHWHLIVMCEGEVLTGKPLKDLIGIDTSPFITWADDIERNDVWSDAVADTVRIPNQVLNVWLSQLIENRTLRNFGMNYYDAKAVDGWSPQTFQPMPWGWIPLPGKPAEVFQKVEIPDLKDSLAEIQFVKGMVESATAATTTTKGETEQRKVTLGEVELAVGQALERITSISKFYTQAQLEYGRKWSQMVIANASKLKPVKLYKKGFRGNYYEQKITPQMLKSSKGYDCRVVSSAEREKKSVETVQKLQAVNAQFPGNSAMTRIYKQKLLEFGGLNPDEMREVMDAETQAQGLQGSPSAPTMPVSMPPNAQPALAAPR